MRNIVSRDIARLAVLCSALAVLGCAPPVLAAQQSRQGKTPGSQASRPELRLGKLEHPPSRIAALPVYFSAGQAKNIGTIRGELAIPKGSWIFQVAEAPAGAWWKVSSKEKPAGKGSAAKTARDSTIIELTFSGGNRTLREGRIGYLYFQVKPEGAAQPAGLALRTVGTAPPLSEPGSPGSSGTPDMPENPPINPVQNCFLFSH